MERIYLTTAGISFRQICMVDKRTVMDGFSSVLWISPVDSIIAIIVHYTVCCIQKTKDVDGNNCTCLVERTVLHSCILRIAKMNSLSAIISVLAIAAVITPTQEPVTTQHDISGYLPVPGSVEGWRPVGSPRVFEGEDLYDFIDGGAVIYYEYGFRQTITQEYENDDGQSIHLEIYEMTSSSSAYGIYTFNRGVEGNRVDIGDEGTIADYYLYFWKGNFLVTLIASDFNKGASEGLLPIAIEVDKRMTKTGYRPSLCNMLMIEGQTPLHIIYLKGTLALRNVYYFAADDIFGLKEGVVGDFGDFRLFVFKYNDAKESNRWYVTARDAMRKEQRFVNFTDYDDEFSVVDEQGLVMQMKPYRSYSFVYLGTPDVDPRAMFYKIESNLR